MAAQTPTFPPQPRRADRAYRVCLVCLGNICRSPMAEVVTRDELARAGLSGAVEVDSAGTGDWHIGAPMDRGARDALARRGYDGSAHRARQFTPSWFARYDLVLAMDRRNLATLAAMHADAAGRLGLFRVFDPAVAAGQNDPYRGEVPDPFGGPLESFETALDLVVPAARGLAARLARLLENPSPPAAGVTGRGRNGRGGNGRRRTGWRGTGPQVPGPQELGPQELGPQAPDRQVPGASAARWPGPR